MNTTTNSCVPPRYQGRTTGRKTEGGRGQNGCINRLRIKFQEAGGSNLIDSFEKDLGKGKHCGRKPCPPCNSSDKRQKCRSRNLVYKSSCLTFNPVSSQKEDHEGPRDGIYIGRDIKINA